MIKLLGLKIIISYLFDVFTVEVECDTSYKGGKITNKRFRTLNINLQAHMKKLLLIVNALMHVPGNRFQDMRFTG